MNMAREDGNGNGGGHSMMQMALVLSGVFASVLVMGIPRTYGESFTLSQIYTLALQENEEVQIARQVIRHAEQGKKRALSAVLPEVTLHGTYNRSPEKTAPFGILQPQDSYEVQMTLEQPLYGGGKSWAGIRMAGREIEVARKSLNLSTEALLLRVAEAIYGALKAHKNLEAQQHNVERLLEHRRLSELRFKVGEVTETVLLRAEAELAGAQAELVARENDLVVKKQELQILADLPERFEIEEPPLPEIPDGSESQLLEIALKNRDDLLRNRLQERIAEERVTFARGNFLPSITLEGTYFSRGQEPRSAFFIRESWFVGGRIEFPIFEGGLRMAELAQARSKLEQDRLETSGLKKQVDLDVTRSFLNLKAITRVSRSRQKQLRFATKNYEMVSKQFTFGLVTNIDLLDANQTLIEAERDLIAAEYERHLAILNLQRSIGIFLPRALDLADARL